MRFMRLHLLIPIVILILYGALILVAVISDHLYLRIAAAALPFLLLTVYLSLYRPKEFALLLTFLLPLSINLKDIGMGFGLSLPAEPMIMIMAALLVINLINGKYISREVLRHPVTIAILLNLVWMYITTAGSSMPAISVKFVIIRTAYLLVFYLFFLQIFSTAKGMQQWIWTYSLALIPVMLYVFAKHSQFGFIQEVNRYVTKPFFNDHTIYGACLAMVLPFFIGHFFLPAKTRILPKHLSWPMILLLLIGIFFSYSRAVWLSIVMVIPAAVILLLKIRFGFIITAILLFSILAIWFRAPILEKMQQVESERGSTIGEHAESIANLSTSASNKERINRWESALAMFRAKPIMGFGPGTYPFQYAPYQREENLTRISTNLGDRGGVHSEYLKPLAESGLPGFLSFLAVVMLTLRTGMRLIYFQKSRQVKILAAALLLGLFTYYVHGFFNFFLDTDKSSVLFWGMTGLIVALDIKYRRANKQL